MTLEQLVLQLNENVSKLCGRVSKIEQSMIDLNKAEKKKRERIFLVIAVVSSVIAVYQSVTV